MAVGQNVDLWPRGAVFPQKMRPPRVFGENFGSRKRYVRSIARDLKIASGPPTELLLNLVMNLVLRRTSTDTVLKYSTFALWYRITFNEVFIHIPIWITGT